ncbi:MAG: DUF1493 family protein [Gemmatimonadaceae bacterium]
MPSFDQIAEFVREETGYGGEITPATKLVEDIGADGDDMFAFIQHYSERFGVDLAGYRWYFHHGEEGWSIGGMFFEPPYGRVPRIPITIGMLHDFAEQKRWGIHYPRHQLPKRRFDLLVNQLIALIVFAVLGYSLWRHFAH